MLKIFVSWSLVVFTLFSVLSNKLAAEGIFDTIISVDGAAITNYELEQRILFFSFLNEPGDTLISSRQSLIDDRLKMAAGSKDGFALTPTELENAMLDFAKNSNQSLSGLLNLLNEGGVDAETFRDYVEVGVVWREVVRKRFGSQSQPTESEIDRALAAERAEGDISVLLTEIVLPAGPSQLEESRKIARELAKITSIGSFSEKAKKLSVSSSRDNGGKIPWRNLKDLPNGLRQIIASLRPGQVAKPLEVQNAIVLFQLRDVEELGLKAPEIISMKFAKITGINSVLDLATKTVNSCNDLYGLVKLDKDVVLEMLTQHPDEIEQATALRLNRLDRHEMSIFSDSPDSIGNMIMLCERNYTTSADISRSEVAKNIRAARLTNLAEGYLAELRTNATVIFK
jgi:peptidyl-prolyl cis-trans isomerase SurA|tara:strand:+ start:7378 stop:8574 length:1197 start_codon:yes stop_codon:yes gene_type:complete